jgi:hypothetical protein
MTKEFHVTDQYMFIKEAVQLGADCSHSLADRRLVSKPIDLKTKMIQNITLSEQFIAICENNQQDTHFFSLVYSN